MRSAQELQTDLQRVQALLRQGTLLSLSDEEKERLLDDSLKLLHKLEAVAESLLVVGLLGGTGVGKSTLMNALAGAPIASTSHRRPHTDQVLIYRHVAMPIPDALTRSSQRRREITHEADAVRHILLCDLPDFDSLLAAHREQVLQFLEHLELLIWVTTPEKYADEKFYTFLREVPKARQNFYFVLNKVDLLFPEGDPGTGHAQLSAVTARFGHHLRDNGVVQPIIYAVSARKGGEADTDASWNQLWHFHHELFRLRDAKELTDIKAANLDVEVKQLAQVLEKEVSGLGLLHGLLKDAVSELENRRTEWVRMGHEAFTRALERNPEDFLPQPAPERALVGIGHGLAAAVDSWQRLTDRSERSGKGAELLLQQAAFETLRHELERVEHRMTYQALQRGLPSAMGEPQGNLFDAAAKWQKLTERWQRIVTEALEPQWAPAFTGFRVIQYISYFALFICLLIALSGEAGLASFFVHPSWYGLLALVTALIRSLFSARGFAALGSFLLLQIFLGFRFYRRYRRLRQRHARKLIESLMVVLNRSWEEELTTLIDELAQRAQQVEERITALRALHRVNARSDEPR